ncbi:MAG: DUF4956 domain-containing protein [Bryobacteraceae bacterium]
MPDFLTAAFANGPNVHPMEMLVRLAGAFGFGLVIAGIYWFTRRKQSMGFEFSMTLLLLCLLIAMVTQVIGDSVARAFSLVGALSIVRFRTVVRDTQDTAYVILSVSVGMAIGARNPWVAMIGIALVVLAEVVLALATRRVRVRRPRFTLRLRVSFDQDPETLIVRILGLQISDCELIALGTGKQGGSIEAAYHLTAPFDKPATEWIRLLADTPGVQNVQLERRDYDSD